MKKFIGLVVLLALVGLSVPVMTHADTVSDLQAKISMLLEQVKALQAQLKVAQGQGIGQFCHTFNTNLGIGASSDDIAVLHQIFRDKENISGPNPAHPDSQNFRNTFEEDTASMITEFQQKYKNEILTPAGLRNGTGYLGARTRAKLNRLYGCGNIIRANEQTVINPPVTEKPVEACPLSIDSRGVISHVCPTTPPTLPPPALPVCSQYQIANPPMPIPGGTTTGGTSGTSVSGTASSMTTSYMPPAYIARPCITHLSPSSGPVETTVAIYGSGFSSNNNIITFAGARIATGVVSSDGTVIKFTVPNAVATGPVCITTPTTPVGQGYSCPPPAARLIVPGTYEISVNNGGLESNSVKFTVTGGIVETRPSLKVLSPNGGEVWVKGTTQTIRWVPPAGLSSVVISLKNNAVPPVCETMTCQYSSKVKTYLLTRQGNPVPNIGSFSWNVGDFSEEQDTTEHTDILPGTYAIVIQALDEKGNSSPLDTRLSYPSGTSNWFNIMSGPNL